MRSASLPWSLPAPRNVVPSRNCSPRQRTLGQVHTRFDAASLRPFIRDLASGHPRVASLIVGALACQTASDSRSVLDGLRLGFRAEAIALAGDGLDVPRTAPVVVQLHT